MNHPNPIVMQAQQQRMQQAASQPKSAYGNNQQNSDEFERNADSHSLNRAQTDQVKADPFARPDSVSGNSYSSNNSQSAQNFSRPLAAGVQRPPNSEFQSHQNFPPLQNLPGPGYPTMSQTPNSENQQGYSQTENNSNGQQDVQMANTSNDPALMASMTPTYPTMPIFGNQGIERSPFAMADDFAAWLFNETTFGGGNGGGGGSNGGSMSFGQGNMTPAVGNTNFTLQAPYFSHDPMVSGYLSQPVPSQHPMNITSLIDTGMQQMALSEERRQQIIELIETRFNDNHAPVKSKDEFLAHRDRDDQQVLSLKMLQIYIASYWQHFHPQLPILHKPTFEANRCPLLLLIAIIALGASCLEKQHGYEKTQNCSELSNFFAWHLRWEIFQARDSRPAAKLWVFQALILLEIFEKMYSTRPLHERAHIHHATTLTLMRRGSALIGRSSLDSPPSGSNPSSRHGSVNGIQTGTGSGAYTADEWWNQWIHNEATRRAAFAAFVMDSIHATMFGHSAVMVAHEMRLPLPCDEALWSATSSGEIGRVESSLVQHGIKSTTFLDGLKKTLSNQAVRTNSFGRTILMAGLLSVSWHMNQRDLQVSSLGVSHALGGRERWRGALTRAFDFWKADFDSSAKPGEPGTYGHIARGEDENIFENRTVMHHLAHMAMHVDIVDCQIFAGANRLLGRSITPQDYNGAQRRMKEGWAPTARARDATFYALKFLAQVMMPDEHGSPHHRPVSMQVGRDARGLYSARDDFLLNRPWVLYFATLIVWSYGYALDGPISPMYALQDYNQVVKDMQGFLNRVGNVASPDDLQHVTNRNACLGLLVLMRDTFKKTRWELLHEASARLTKCIEKLANGANCEFPMPPA
jgi:hypothetical protein